MNATMPRMSLTIRRVQHLWAELDYAPRRLLEIRTGVPLSRPQDGPRTAASVDELEALYAAGEQLTRE